MRGAPQERVIKDLNPIHRACSQYHSSVVSCKISSSLDNILCIENSGSGQLLDTQTKGDAG
ncbi:hypothetical protein GOM44_05450 [Wolbachia endosymbiont of Atemnus politus]|uniref:group II intron maturase-specific domain-containing protein n=1 Tax=Wolbachia endosymbiont of Atemnus politus TaxID=2682840 RepID=UPI001571CAC4|nr:hypothetical protein [Wolbachia endosymbiont of Atemnus politus]